MTTLSDAQEAGFIVAQEIAGEDWTPRQVDAASASSAVTVVVVDQGDGDFNERRSVLFLTSDWSARDGDVWTDPDGASWLTKQTGRIQGVVTRIDLEKTREDQGA